MDLNAILALKEDYLRIQDPTEYRFATRCFPGGWPAWQACSESQEYSPITLKWRQELAVKMRSDAFRRIQEAAEGETRDALSANKYIYEILTEKNKDSVGRPSNEKIQQKAKEFLEDERKREEAYLRILGSNAIPKDEER